MPITTLVSSATASSPDLFTVSLSQAASIAWSAFTGGNTAQQLASLVNADLIAAEGNEPDGTQMQLVIQGWLNPITGTDYSADMAEYINQEWQAGQIIGSTGDPVEPWYDSSGQPATAIAYPSSNTVTLQWTIGSGPSLVAIVVAIAVGLVALVLIINDIKGLLPWSLGAHTAGAATSPGGSGGFWSSIPLWAKLAGGAGILAGGVALISYKERVGIAQAGANRSSINIYEPGQGGYR